MRLQCHPKCRTRVAHFHQRQVVSADFYWLFFRPKFVNIQCRFLLSMWVWYLRIIIWKKNHFLRLTFGIFLPFFPDQFSLPAGMPLVTTPISLPGYPPITVSAGLPPSVPLDSFSADAPSSGAPPTGLGRYFTSQHTWKTTNHLDSFVDCTYVGWLARSFIIWCAKFVSGLSRIADCGCVLQMSPHLWFFKFIGWTLWSTLWEYFPLFKDVQKVYYWADFVSLKTCLF